MTFPYEPEDQQDKKGFTPAKLIAVCALTAILGFGLCATAPNGFLSEHPSWSVPVGGWIFMISACGILIGIVWLIMNALSD